MLRYNGPAVGSSFQRPWGNSMLKKPLAHLTGLMFTLLPSIYLHAQSAPAVKPGGEPMIFTSQTHLVNLEVAHSPESATTATTYFTIDAVYLGNGGVETPWPGAFVTAWALTPTCSPSTDPNCVTQASGYTNSSGAFTIYTDAINAQASEEWELTITDPNNTCPTYQASSPQLVDSKFNPFPYSQGFWGCNEDYD